MRSGVVVLSEPVIDDELRLLGRREPLCIENLSAQRAGSLLLWFGTPRAVSRVTEKVPSTSRHCRTSILETRTASLTLTDDLFLLLTTSGVVNE